MLSTSSWARNGLYLYCALLSLTSDISASPITSSRDNTASVDPTPVPITPSFVSNIYENTHTAVTGVDGHATSIPIVGGPECWFCPLAEKGHASNNLNNSKDGEFETQGAWALVGINRPGVYQPLIAPGSSKQIPVVTVLNNGNPRYSPTQTTGQSATKVKRDGIYTDIPTETTYLYTERFQTLRLGMPDVVRFEDVINKRFAMTESRGSRQPNLLTGIVTAEEKVQTIYDKNSDSGVVKVIHWIELDWEIVEWRFKYNRELHVLSYEDAEVSESRFSLPGYRDGSRYKYLGRIRKRADVAFIKEKAGVVKEKIEEKGYYSGWHHLGGFKWTKKPRIIAKELYDMIKKK